MQQLLREEPRTPAFSAFADVSLLFTNNVGLTRKHPSGDAFLVSTLGLGYRHDLPLGLRFEAGVSLAAFRYDRFPRLGFNSLDGAVSLSYHTALLSGLDLSAGYAFTDLSDRSPSSFFTNHAIDLSVQKTVSLGRAQTAFAGLSAEIGFADPGIADRNEYAAFAGYALQAARHWSVDLLYRYAFYDYAQGDRRDHHHTLTLNSRFRFTENFSAYVTSYFVLNDSNEQEFDYRAATVGAGLNFKLRF